MNLDSLPGIVLDEKYRIEQQLGKGGMGAVFRATHLGTTRTVAVKVIVPQLAGEDEFLLRFQREAEAAGRLRHPNVVNVTDFGSTQLHHGRLAYLVMEFLDGQNLAAFLKKNPRPAVDEILDILDQVALALDIAHQNGIVHRDLKPDNIWLQPNHRGGFNVKVLDFGIAKLRNPLGTALTETAGPAPEVETLAPARSTFAPDEAETVAMAPSVRPAGTSATQGATNATSLETVAGSVLGTPAYMAPEQCQGRDVQASADIYSLSVIVYQMFCGCLPFEARALAELLHKQIAELPTPPAVRDPGISKRVSEAILSGLAKAPEDRPPSAAAFAARLRGSTEAELKLLADGKGVASNYGNSFFPLLLACFVPYIPIMAGLYLAMRTLAKTNIVPAGVLVAGFQILLFAVLFLLSQTYKAGATLLLKQAASAGHFRQQWRPQFWELVRGFHSFLVTHFRNTFDFHPRSFLAGQIWPVVWASERLSGKPCLIRAARLAGAEPAAAAALAARQWGILLAATLFMPVLLVIPGNLSLYVLILSGPANLLAGFVVLYPMFLSLMIFRFFGPAFFFLYLSASRCLGEGIEFSLPSARREKRSRGRTTLFRPATIAWLLLPVLMSVFLLYKGLSHGESRIGLFDAAASGRSAAVLRALDSGYSVDASDINKWTILMHAVAAGDLDLMRVLLGRHAKVNEQNSNGDTALLLALWNRREDAAEILISNGANVELPNDRGQTALFSAAMHGDLRMCKLLLAQGADKTHRDQQGKTALDYAREEGHAEVVALLLDSTSASTTGNR